MPTPRQLMGPPTPRRNPAAGAGAAFAAGKNARRGLRQPFLDEDLAAAWRALGRAGLALMVEGPGLPAFATAPELRTGFAWRPTASLLLRACGLEWRSRLA